MATNSDPDGTEFCLVFALMPNAMSDESFAQLYICLSVEKFIALVLTCVHTEKFLKINAY